MLAHRSKVFQGIGGPGGGGGRPYYQQEHAEPHIISLSYLFQMFWLIILTCDLKEYFHMDLLWKIISLFKTMIVISTWDTFQIVGCVEEPDNLLSVSSLSTYWHLNYTKLPTLSHSHTWPLVTALVHMNFNYKALRIWLTLTWTWCENVILKTSTEGEKSCKLKLWSTAIRPVGP